MKQTRNESAVEKVRHVVMVIENGMFVCSDVCFAQYLIWHNSFDHDVCLPKLRKSNRFYKSYSLSPLQDNNTTLSEHSSSVHSATHMIFVLYV